MMTDLSRDSSSPRRRPLWANRWLRFAAIAIGSAIGGYFIGDWLAASQLLEPYDPAIKAWSREQGALGFACALVAFMLGILGLSAGVISLFPGMIRRALKAEPGEDISRALASHRFGAAAAVAMALMLGVFVVPGLPALIGLGVAFAALAFLAWATVALMRAGDELYTHVQVESWAWTGVVIQTGISGWAAMAWFNVAPALDPRGVMLSMVSVALLTSAILVVRRGMIAE